jgi:hypothetical protein
LAEASTRPDFPSTIDPYGDRTAMQTVRFLAAGVACLGLLSGCQSEPKRPPASGGGKSASLRVMEQVAIAAHKCWFAAKDPAFRSYRFANELNSMSGQPRFLLVPANNFGGRPLLVVQAKGGSSRVDVFGPLMGEPVGTRITADLARWQGGNPSCSGAA